MKEYVSIAELSDMAELPNSTCRRYLANFEQFFVVKGGNRLKKYEVGAVAVIKRIKDLYDGGMDTHEIHSTLANEFPMVMSNDEEVEKNVPTLVTSEDIAEIKQALEEQKQFNAELLQTLKDQHIYYEKKFNNLVHDRELISSLRDSMEQRRLDNSDDRLKEIEKKLAEQNTSTDELQQLVGTLIETIRESAATNQEQNKKGFWSKLFGK
ncbi:MAG TPA: hypothetical protein VNR38_25690 [Ureibacillus sp.]|nr:hypothetical protein [Ureibacillus sp.]